jgi:aminopeptidase N
MDEGLNTFSHARVVAEAFSPDYQATRFFGGFVPWQFRDIVLSRATDGNGMEGYRVAATRDAMINATYTYWPATHWGITYSKAALMLHTIERLVGWERLRPALATYFQRYRFKHPRPDDFFNVLLQETGHDLRPFLEDAYAGSAVFDYAAERLDSQPVSSRGFVESSSGMPPAFQDTQDPAQFRTTVVVRRLGDARFPVDVVVTFETGEQVRERWDGQARWQPFEYIKPSRAVSVQVDPDRVLLLDTNYTNNSITLTPRARDAADRWALTWVVWLQDLLLDHAFFV